ncbi:MAG: peptidoglycan-binding domain-containing protein [Clostridia bacterium]
MAQFEDSLPYHPWGSRDLQFQDPSVAGTDVKILQTLFNQFLRHSAPRPGPIATVLVEDGVFGSHTAAVVRSWQHYFRLTVDGVVGVETGATLGQYGQAYGGPPFGVRYIDTVGESGGDVMVLQNRLNCYRYGNRTGSSATGTFDASTRDAVRHLQRDLNLLGLDAGVPVDGLARFETLDGLAAYTYLGGRTLYSGRHGIDTLWLQRFLAARACYGGAPDGVFGPATARAVKQFQAASGLPPDGSVGPLTMYHIGKHFSHPVSSWP